MIVMSNNLRPRLPMDQGVTVRVNVAWVDTVVDLITILEDLKTHDVYVDYPTGRKKPPVPTITYNGVLDIIGQYDNVKYFAVSNAEGYGQMERVREEVPNRIQIIPKIETEIGVLNLFHICSGAMTDIVMLDKEDLYTDVHQDAKKFNNLVDVLRVNAAKQNIRVLEMQGVVFYER